MANHQSIKFSGMLNQHEFKERYIFIMQRIENDLSKEDIAFLLGRTSYHVIDYESFSDQVKMDYEDHEVMAELFKTPFPATPAFNSKVNKVDISMEKRLIRGTCIQTDRELHYHFIHPWTIKGINEPLTILKPIQSKTRKDEELSHELRIELARLTDFGYFNNKSPAITIYRHMQIHVIPDWQPLLVPALRQVVFEFIRSEKLQLKNERGHIYYQTKL
ncbi:hypothetical protein [Pedobacter nutrimenti]|uniref:hypothetical protein n=1 Tax=Pedobacter nutrimenti TaxID=1241337 RepID=UPI002931887A|nr:hypothetical protein [Pedobacter nutrimenti]